MKRQFLTLQKANKLERSTEFLSNIEAVDDIEFVIGESEREEDENSEFTEMLQELCELNKKRRKILEQFYLARNSK